MGPGATLAHSSILAARWARASAASLPGVKRQAPHWPKDIVEVPSAHVDSRSESAADPAATQRISRALLEDALQRTKSGTRQAVRGRDDGVEPDEVRIHEAEPHDPRDSFFGPRDSYVDDSPMVTVVAIESMEMAAFDPAKALAARAAHGQPAPHAVAPSQPEPAPRFAQLTSPQPAHRKRVVALIVVSLVAFFAAAATIGFVAGRLTHH